MFSDHFLHGKSPTECFTYEAFYHDTISNPILQMGKSSLRYVRNLPRVTWLVLPEPTLYPLCSAELGPVLAQPVSPR